MMGPNHLEFLQVSFETAEKELLSQTQLLADQARSLRKRWWLLDKFSLGFIIGGAAFALAGLPDWWQLSAVGVVFWILVELTKMRYEQVYAQIQREGQSYQLRSMCAVAIITALSETDIELPNTFHSVDDLLADILKEDQ